MEKISTAENQKSLIFIVSFLLFKTKSGFFKKDHWNLRLKISETWDWNSDSKTLSQTTEVETLCTVGLVEVLILWWTSEKMVCVLEWSCVWGWMNVSDRKGLHSWMRAVCPVWWKVLITVLTCWQYSAFYTENFDIFVKWLLLMMVVSHFTEDLFFWCNTNILLIWTW